MVTSTRRRPLVTYNRVKVSSSGQVTLPAEIRRVLGVEPGDTVVFRSDKDGNVIVRKPMTADDLAGIAGPRPDNLDGILLEARHHVRGDKYE